MTSLISLPCLLFSYMLLRPPPHFSCISPNERLPGIEVHESIRDIEECRGKMTTPTNFDMPGAFPHSRCLPNVQHNYQICLWDYIKLIMTNELLINNKTIIDSPNLSFRLVSGHVISYLGQFLSQAHF